MNIWNWIANSTAVVLYVCVWFLVTRSQTKQSFASWILWATIDTVAAAAIICKGGNFELPTVYSVGSIVIAASLFMKREYGWRRFDSYVTALVLICIVIWWQAGPVAAVVASSIAMFIAGLPMLRDAYESPFDVPVVVYILATIGNLCGVVAGKNWSVQERLYPLLAFAYTLILVIIIYWRRISMLRQQRNSSR